MGPLTQPAAVRQRSRRRIEFSYGDLARYPERVGSPLGRDRAGQFSARRADYRILCTISDHRVQVVQVDHRNDAYRPS